MKRGAHYIAVLCGLVLVIGWNLPVWAQTEPVNLKPVLVIELQTGSVQNTHDKFVAIYNPNFQSVDVTNWELQYRAANAGEDKPWHTRAKLNCELADDTVNQTCRVQMPAQSKLWLASYDLGMDRQSHDLKGSIAARGGQLRLVKPGNDDQPDMPQDMLGYGNALVAAGDQPAPAPPKGQSLRRKAGADGQFVNTNNNANDFFVEGESTVTPDQPPIPSAPKGDAKPKIYPIITITELLPIATSMTDGFIELYNPQDTPVSLRDYVLQTGLTWNHHFTLPDVTIAGYSYLALFRGDTRLQLIKKGSVARLLSPSGEVVSFTKPYPTAKPGQAWAQTTDGDWQWTATPTPGAANILTVPPLVKPIKTAKTLADNSKPKKDKTVGPKKSAKTEKKPKADKTSTKKTKPVTKSKDAAPAAAPPASSPSKPSANYWFIGMAVVLAGGYGIFEYRRDLMGWIRNLRKRGR